MIGNKKVNFASDEAGELATSLNLGQAELKKIKGSGSDGGITVADIKATQPKGSLEVTDAESEAVQKTPNRVTLAQIEEKIVNTEFIYPEGAPHFTIAVVFLANGFFVTGESAPADPENFDKELGKKFAYEMAVRKIWPLEGYCLRENLHNAASVEAAEGEE